MSLTAELNLIAPLISNFYLASYGKQAKCCFLYLQSQFNTFCSKISKKLLFFAQESVKNVIFHSKISKNYYFPFGTQSKFLFFSFFLFFSSSHQFLYISCCVRETTGLETNIQSNILPKISFLNFHYLNQNPFIFLIPSHT